VVDDSADLTIMLTTNWTASLTNTVQLNLCAPPCVVTLLLDRRHAAVLVEEQVVVV
jgi:hypothetical protein